MSGGMTEINRRKRLRRSEIESSVPKLYDTVKNLLCEAGSVNDATQLIVDYFVDILEERA